MGTARRRTRIVATVGPATRGPEALEALLAAGVDVVRLNFSHGTAAEHVEVIRRVRELERRLGRPVGVLQDLAGPKIRLGRLPEGGVRLEPGATVLLAPEGTGPEGALPVAYPRLLEDVAPGDPILLADGAVELEVVARQRGALRCTVRVGGALASHKGVNLPASRLAVETFTATDREDLEVGLEAGVDLVALSFVRHERDLEPVMERLRRADPRPLLVAKIEKPEAVDRLEAILERVDAVMVARGDLGVEMRLEEVPLIQKRIIHAARRAGKPVITATQMLRSMVASPRPTRAEASDVANAILDGTDAVMLSEETAVSAYPVEAVRVLDRIARAVEPHLPWERYLEERPEVAATRVTAAVSHAACWLARDVGAAAIVASTTSGATARAVARFRPPVPVVALTPSVEVARQLAVSWGVETAVAPAGLPSAEAMFAAAERLMLERGLEPGQRVVVTAGLPMAVPGGTNLVHVLELGSGGT